jgi:hypothetical protein
MIEPLRAILPSFTQVILDFPAHQGFFLIGCSAANFGGKLVASAWASDHVYNTAKGRYENWQPPAGTPFRVGRVLSDRPPYLVQLRDDLSVERVDDILIAPSANQEMESIRLSRGGFDGLKPFEWRGQLWCDFYTGGYGNVKFWMGRLDGATLVDCRRLQSPGPRRDEKNWMPEIDGNDELRYHYKVGVLTDVNGKLTDAGRPDLNNLHGGTQVVHGLAIVHDFRYEDAGRVYRHYFVRFDQDGKPYALSRPFVLADVERVEVVCGLAKHPDGKRLVISHGPCLATVDLDEVLHMPWDGVPQPAPPRRPPPRTPLRVRAPTLIGVRRRGAGTGVHA